MWLLLSKITAFIIFIGRPPVCLVLLFRLQVGSWEKMMKETYFPKFEVPPLVTAEAESFNVVGLRVCFLRVGLISELDFSLLELSFFKFIKLLLLQQHQLSLLDNTAF